MMNAEIIRLNLANPLFFARAKSDPFDYDPARGEMLFCFEIDEPAYYEFEPDRKFFPGNLVFCGKSTEKGSAGAVPALVCGNYFFLQINGIPDRDEIIDLAVELQQECLWQRLCPAKFWFLRRLFEDGRTVTQLFRPCFEKPTSSAFQP